MASTNYPGSLDTYPVPNNGDTISVADHWLGPATIAIETELGTDPAGSHTNVKNRLDQVDSAMGFKNRIIGGNFSTNPWQRGTTFNSASSGIYSADRWQNFDSSTATVNIVRSADAPTVAEAGVFSQHSLDVDVAGADAALTAAQIYLIGQKVEGYNVLDLGFGQSGTRYLTLSFWHKHTKTGTYCVALQNNAENRSYVAEYTQTTTNTWEKAELTIPVDTSGTWLYDNNTGIRLYFALAVGTDYHTSANTWSAGNYYSTSSQVNALDSTSNNFKIALVQLEAGDKATRFETRSVGQELELCQRYYQQQGINFYTIARATGTGTGVPFVGYDFRQEMRAAPSVTDNSLWDTGTGYQVPVYSGISSTKFYFSGGTSISDGAVNWLNGGTVYMNAEL